MNLLEDARVDVPAEIKQAILQAYDEDFHAWYRVMATQFHCRVIGLFVRLAALDGKTGYLCHLPRLAAYIRRGLEDPLLAPLQKWFAAQGISFEAAADFDPAALRGRGPE